MRRTGKAHAPDPANAEPPCKARQTHMQLDALLERLGRRVSGRALIGRAGGHRVPLLLYGSVGLINVVDANTGKARHQIPMPLWDAVAHPAVDGLDGNRPFSVLALVGNALSAQAPFIGALINDRLDVHGENYILSNSEIASSKK